MQSILCFFLLLVFSPYSIAKQSQASAQNQTAIRVLKSNFKQYKLTNFKINVEQEIFISGIKSTIKSKGTLSIHGDKFRMKLYGNPSSLLVFDGTFLWYQADIKERTVFKIHKPSQIQILTSFFNKTSFFKNFNIKKSQKNNKTYIFQIQPKTEITGLNEMFLQAGSYISELRLIWKDLDNWQKYTFSKPKHIKHPQSFTFSSAGFQVITKASF